jgi:tetratricopeptide (TPR) repeat protein
MGTTQAMGTTHAVGTTHAMGTEANASADAELDRALDSMAAGAPGDAVVWLQQALGLDPDHVAATHALLRALEDCGRLNEAVALARRSIERWPDDVLAHTRLSILLQKLGDVPAAEAAAGRARILGWKLELRSGTQAAGNAAATQQGH